MDSSGGKGRSARRRRARARKQAQALVDGALVCARCLRRPPQARSTRALLRCARCYAVAYCSEECSEADAQRHSAKECAPPSERRLRQLRLPLCRDANEEWGCSEVQEGHINSQLFGKPQKALEWFSAAAQTAGALPAGSRVRGEEGDAWRPLGRCAVVCHGMMPAPAHFLWDLYMCDEEALRAVWLQQQVPEELLADVLENVRTYDPSREFVMLWIRPELRLLYHRRVRLETEAQWAAGGDGATPPPPPVDNEELKSGAYLERRIAEQQQQQQVIK